MMMIVMMMMMMMMNIMIIHIDMIFIVDINMIIMIINTIIMTLCPGSAHAHAAGAVPARRPRRRPELERLTLYIIHDYIIYLFILLLTIIDH